MSNAETVDELVGAAMRDARGVVVLTGAGISAESGIPTFRGKEGYWTVGAREYHPQEMATAATFSEMPDEVWRWYLYRRSVCRAAAPNPGHAAVVALESGLGERFRLVTQNVDGLHIRAGNTLGRTYQIHGNIDFMRCSRACSTELEPIPESIPPKGRDDALTDDERALLRCGRCGQRSRPHVLWFDEYYDEPLFRAESSLAAAQQAGLLIVVGTSGATTLPTKVAVIVAQTGGAIIDINPEPNPFSELAARVPAGLALQGSAGELLPGIVDHVLEAS